ncbi:hypothetical protein IAR55_004256 [Kwoniella newhampshirensis]|uniref:Prephenate dehydratase domain-containing protein n=1 Tax=Kwoniella newhampshirensis TaxID=1651941 RepID=A0AAW0YJ78_9TREE
MAYLGPRGTYGEQAARAFASRYNDSSIDLIPCPSISEVYSHPADFVVLPLENTLQGGVVETLDNLLSILLTPPSESSRDAHTRRRKIVMDLALPIRHCLVAKKGTKLEDIRWIRSHEQALGQSAQFLSRHLPAASLQPYPSTARAAVSLLSEADSSGRGAALCSKAIMSLYPAELEVLFEGTQAIENNFTRFLLLQRDTHAPPPTPTSSHNSHPTHFYALRNASLLAPVLSVVKPIEIHSRPCPPNPNPHISNGHKDEGEGLFPTWYLVEISSVAQGEEDNDDGMRSLDGVVCLGSTAGRMTPEELAVL